MIEHLASSLLNDIREKIGQFDASESSAAPKLKALLEARLRQMNLVTREEFDAQSAVLARTRAKIEALEAQVRALEANLSGPTKPL
tara:strand:+ start:56 stop:313 length:258 start_codon:yes stop_codon:yes gene_type:complete